MSSRRRFLSYCLAAPALTWGCRSQGSGPAPSVTPEPAPTPAPTPVKSLLVLGGTRFLGPAIVDEALAAGLEVTLFNRGKSDPDAYPELEKLVGNRDPELDEGLRALEGRTWDAVIDTSGYFPRMVRASAELLAPNVGQYIFISSISAYAAHDHPGDDETATLAKLEDPTVETMGEAFQNYGGLKVLCEQAAEAAMPGRVANVRPGYIVGPRDPTDRFTYWPWRVSQGGTVLAPGAPKDSVQIIDVRDLGRWLVHLATSRTMGVFNAVGPKSPTTMGEILEASKKASGSDARFVWAPLDFLEAHGGEANPLPIPIWAPSTGETAGFHHYRNDRAVKAGLTFRSVEQTTADTLEWFRSQPEERRATLRAGLPSEQEQALLAELAAVDARRSARVRPDTRPHGGIRHAQLTLHGLG
ncbi:NAD-dependent epimerase/dehydratase family protein [Paraliomyxa miuraensis]|uniref:NAD-dependent epimerase/dehydratase family protein n=1 Tax=Paraliomyxa miuraensis TaxID=376150 RepID=UPI002259EDFD|nr:NAD-dependent epimerase/dehydratase family protein [Paraliomyxa miuraensis]MCX4247165.1 epimerase [Paraliomyxa miuraensis]